MKYFYALIAILFTANLFCQDTIRKYKVNDWIKFNIQVGYMINSSYSNSPYKKTHDKEEKISENYYSNNKKRYFSSPNIGINIILGKHPNIKHILGINYLHSKGEFDYSYTSYLQYRYYNESLNTTKNFHYISNASFLNVYSGIRLIFLKHILFEPNLSISFIKNKTVQISGYEVTNRYDFFAPQYVAPIKDTTFYDNKVIEDYDLGSTISFCPRIGYEFNIKNQKIGLYLARNFCINTRLPWWMFGVTYYPFKKLK